MVKKQYNASTVDECLELASNDLKVPVENIKYEILSEKKGLFKRHVEIEVEYEEKPKIDTVDENNGTVQVIDGEIIIKNPRENGKNAIIAATPEVYLTVNGERVTTKAEVNEESEIEVYFDESKASRVLNIITSENKMEAFASIKYAPEFTYKLKDTEVSNFLTLIRDIKCKDMPPKYKLEEIKDELRKNGINYGIIEENLIQCTKGDDAESILVAKGEPLINDEDDIIEYKFNVEKSAKKIIEDNEGRVDFKSIGTVEAIKEGQVLAIKHDGNPGQDGKDITGVVKKHKNGKKLTLKAGEGCTIKDNTIVSTTSGRPSLKNGVVHVNQIYTISEDVGIKTGNIKFIGNIVIDGEVNEGMKVEAGNDIEIKKNVDRSEIKAKGNILINGNIIASKVSAGGTDIDSLREMENLDGLKKNLDSILETALEIKKFNLLGNDTTDGETIKVLIEKKFRNVPKICFALIGEILRKEQNSQDRLVSLMRNKLIGLGPISIKQLDELQEMIDIIDEKKEMLKDSLSIPVDVTINYCQDSQIDSTGDIIIMGKGEYVSKINANGNIYFTGDKSVARGGIIKAKREVRCKVVGSIAGVATKIAVDSNGHIWSDVCYQNTIFLIGNKEYILDIPSRNIHAYLDENREIVVEKLKL